ncbi:MAG: TonB-dependent receptor [Candidatus Andeanibacterium colombiense]|uniref:TonB-dependent receptor n=1 Tax=Candidatus Andeanibacterium colombiense TaxID=3121345 RepID=A0AAJ5X938_9SPHN|nr:MAG: TonB-dependent receptor [Sphingomonadaceae bacterium]
MLALAHGLGLGATAAEAQTAAAGAAKDGQIAFAIPAGSVGDALRAYADTTGLQLIYNAALDTAGRSPGVEDSLGARDALTRLLAGTGLSFRFVNGNTVTIEGAGGDGEVVTGAVQVEGVQGSPWFGGGGRDAGVNGMNGSRDITATEGTGSFTSGALTIGSKVPQALKDVPQSISVLTSERLEQQNVTDFADAMRQLPGVTLVQGTSSIENIFYSRGYEIKSIQVDGGAPLATALASGAAFGFYPQIDMSIYDHVELLRGAQGQFGSYGDPGGTVNLVRKKPLDHAQFAVEAQAGSWQNYRLVADATSPLALDGKLRGRLVMTYQDNRYFYQTAKDNKTLIYGIAELDLTPTTLITAGINYTRQNSLPWFGGLPRYLTGGDLELPRSTSLALPWNRWEFDTTELFGSIEQKFGQDWTLKLNLTDNRQSSTRKIGYSSGAVDPATHTGPYLSGTYNNYASKQFSAEATLIGAIELFGQRQEVTIGVNRVKSDGDGLTNYSQLISATAASPYQPYPGGPVYCTSGGACPVGSIHSSPPVDVFAFDPRNPLYTEPRNPLIYYRFPKLGQTQTGAYINLRLTAFGRLHLTTGLHWSRYEYENEYEYLCTATTGSCAGKQIGDVYYSSPYIRYGANDFSWPPPINLSFDVTKSLTVYAGYTDIYQSQGSLLGHDHSPMPPVTGSNWEGGLKWAAANGKLNLSLAGYQIRQKGFATLDPPDGSEYEDLGNGIECCFVADKEATQVSKGIDFEATGEIVRGWQVSASYTYNENRYEGISYATQEGTPLVSIQPKHLYKLWMSYDFGAAGREGLFSGLTLSGGVNGQSSAFYAGTVCKTDFIVTSSTSGIQSCPGKIIDDVYVPGSVDYAFTVPGHAVVSARIDYRFSGTWSAALNLDNIFDKVYYQTVGSSPSGGNWYGTPRSFTATLRAKW